MVLEFISRNWEYLCKHGNKRELLLHTGTMSRFMVLGPHFVYIGCVTSFYDKMISSLVTPGSYNVGTRKKTSVHLLYREEYSIFAWGLFISISLTVV